MKRTLLIPALVVSALLASGTVYCQDSEYGKTNDGKVVSVDVQNSQIVIKTYTDIAFSVTGKTSIINRDGTTIRLSDINPGNYAVVDYYDDNSGRHVATHIEVAYDS